MHVAVRRLTLRASHCHSLKEKRAVLRKLEGRVRARFHLSIAEVAEQDNWQRLVIGFAVVSSDRISVERISADIARFIAHTGLADVVYDEHELLAYGDGPMGDEAMPGDHDDPSGDPLDADWIPDSWKNEDHIA